MVILLQTSNFGRDIVVRRPSVRRPSVVVVVRPSVRLQNTLGIYKFKGLRPTRRPFKNTLMSMVMLFVMIYGLFNELLPFFIFLKIQEISKQAKNDGSQPKQQ